MGKCWPVCQGLADAVGSNAPALQAQIPERYEHLFRVGHSVNGFEPVDGNRGQLLQLEAVPRPIIAMRRNGRPT